MTHTKKPEMMAVRVGWVLEWGPGHPILAVHRATGGGLFLPEEVWVMALKQNRQEAGRGNVIVRTHKTWLTREIKKLEVRRVRRYTVMLREVTGRMRG
ncbi:MAG: hypothetical protein L0Y56_02985 [Nitrospira sp.]|nr:hypothetical protein [Nitrospira sp.]